MKKYLSTLALTAMLSTASIVKAETIDVGIFYTNSAVAKTANIHTKINQLISFSNQVYRQNGINLTLRLVGKQSVSASATPNGDWLRAFTNSSWVNNLRNQWKADMIAVIGTGESSTPGYKTCGIAWVGQGQNGYLYSSQSSKMFSITAADCGASTFVHELGHNQGLAHSRKQGATSGGVYVDGMGHGVQNSFTSIMAYPHVFGSATQYDYFANPNWTVNGRRFGVTGESYGWKTVNHTKNSISRFK
ncbi:zinc-dependent metalloprotease family protein [Thalassotalea piscium]|uniref:Uncharacterized protein n=1 Tax=Thalassotalea piscium TaxID=1230533 RepID=A0A7X0NFS9_9GAMM|nr:zinc-dependent metalloprotease family protein [Thalassotalea piscium]MBB6542666.1 hypothetical protein [Thalassotalea piscium]